MNFLKAKHDCSKQLYIVEAIGQGTTNFHSLPNEIFEFNFRTHWALSNSLFMVIGDPIHFLILHCSLFLYFQLSWSAVWREIFQDRNFVLQWTSKRFMFSAVNFNLILLPVFLIRVFPVHINISFSLALVQLQEVVSAKVLLPKGWL